MSALAPTLAEVAFSQLPPTLQTPENKQGITEAAQETVELKTYPAAALSSTLQILRAWITGLILEDGPTPGTTRILISYRKTGHER